MGKDTSGDLREQALRLLKSALELLDESATPADVGAHVDTAIVRLSMILDESGDSAQQVSQ